MLFSVLDEKENVRMNELRLFLFSGLLTIYVGGLASHAAEGQVLLPEARQAPSRGSPKMARAKIGADGDLAITEIIENLIPEISVEDVPYTVVREIDGRRVQEQGVRKVPVQSNRLAKSEKEYLYRAVAFRVFRDGRILGRRTAQTLLGHQSPVVYFNAYNRNDQLDPFYVEFLKPGTIVIAIEVMNVSTAGEFP
jgi:hypothetical protein